MTHQEEMCTTGYVKRKVSSLNCRSVSTNLLEKGYLILIWFSCGDNKLVKFFLLENKLLSVLSDGLPVIKELLAEFKMTLSSQRLVVNLEGKSEKYINLVIMNTGQRKTLGHQPESNPCVVPIWGVGPMWIIAVDACL